MWIKYALKSVYKHLGLINEFEFWSDKIIYIIIGNWNIQLHSILLVLLEFKRNQSIPLLDLVKENIIVCSKTSHIDGPFIVGMTLVNTSITLKNRNLFKNLTKVITNITNDSPVLQGQFPSLTWASSSLCTIHLSVKWTKTKILSSKSVNNKDYPQKLSCNWNL